MANLTVDEILSELLGRRQAKEQDIQGGLSELFQSLGGQEVPLSGLTSDPTTQNQPPVGIPLQIPVQEEKNITGVEKIRKFLQTSGVPPFQKADVKLSKVIPKAEKTKKKKSPTAKEREDIARANASIDSLNNLKSLVDKSFTGPFDGRTGAIKNVFGLNSDRQAEFIAATAAFKNSVIQLLTGAAMGDKETIRIMNQIPTENDADNVWLAKYRQSIKNIEFIQNRRKEVLEESGLKTPGLSGFGIDEDTLRDYEILGIE